MYDNYVKDGGKLLKTARTVVSVSVMFRSICRFAKSTMRVEKLFR